MVLDYIESRHWRGWYAHEFDWTGRYVGVRRCPTEEVLDALSDDETMYRPPAEREADAARDPVVIFPKWLVEQGHATDARLKEIQEEVMSRPYPG